MNKPRQKTSRNSMLRKISELPSEYFDGHTDFAELTPRQRILWLSSTNYFLFQAAKNNPRLGCASFFKKKQ